MSHKNRNRIMELAGLSHRSKLLLEAEDEDIFGDEEEGGDEEDEGEDEGEDEDEDEDEEDDEKEEEPEEEPEEEKISDKDIAKYGPGLIDSEIDSILKTIYDTSVQTASVKSATSLTYPGTNEKVEESIEKYSMKYFLLKEEVEEEPVASSEFSLDYFTSEVARYINNYESLLDMEGMLFNKARQFLLNQFGTETEADFVQKLALTHSLDFENKFIEDDNIPVAVGGSSEAAGA